VWGTHWPGDPKLVWTLLAWALYGLLLHQRLALGWKGRRMAIGALTAIGFLLAALAATGLFFQSVHTFG
jgi:ABC-type transport system involved in cytochrome c biogenesis permease subunit